MELALTLPDGGGDIIMDFLIANPTQTLNYTARLV